MQSQQLEAYQWENRILILSDASSDSRALQLQLQKFTEDRKALEERDLLIFQLSEDGVYSASGELTEMEAKKLRSELHILPDFKGILLFGKDGGVKLKEKFPVAPQKVYDLIDGMPMRRAEMRKSGKS